MASFLQQLGPALGTVLKVAGTGMSTQAAQNFQRQNELSNARQMEVQKMVIGLLATGAANGVEGAEQNLSKAVEQFGGPPGVRVGINPQTQLARREVADFDRRSQLRDESNLKIRQIWSGDIDLKDKLLNSAYEMTMAERHKEAANLIDIAGELPDLTESLKGRSDPYKKLRDYFTVLEQFGPDSEFTKNMHQAWQNSVETDMQAKMRYLKEENVPDEIVKKFGIGALEVKADPVHGGIFVVDKTSGQKVWSQQSVPTDRETISPITQQEAAAQPPQPGETFGLGAQWRNAWNVFLRWAGFGMPAEQFDAAKKSITALNTFTSNSMASLNLDDSRFTNKRWEAIAALLPKPAGFLSSPQGAENSIKAFISEATSMKRAIRSAMEKGTIRPNQVGDYTAAISVIDETVGRYSSLIDRMQAAKPTVDEDEMMQEWENYLGEIQQNRTNQMGHRGVPTTPKTTSPEISPIEETTIPPLR